MHNIVLRVFFPATWALNRYSERSSSGTHTAADGSTTYRRASTSDSIDDALFSAESGEAMVGFDVPGVGTNAVDPREANRRRRENMERFAERNMAFARGMTGGGAGGDNDGIRVGRDAAPERRLNRELEAGFMDDSDDDDDETDDRGVTVGRRSFSTGR